MTLRRAAAAAAGHGGHGRRQVPRGRGPVQRSLVRPRLRLHRPHLPRRVLALHIQCLRHIHTVPAAVRAAFCWSAFACSGSGDWGRVASKYDNNVASFSQCLQNFHQAQGALLFPAHSFSPSLPPSLPPFLTLSPPSLFLSPTLIISHARTHVHARRARIGDISVAEINELEVRCARSCPSHGSPIGSPREGDGVVLQHRETRRRPFCVRVMIPIGDRRRGGGGRKIGRERKREEGRGEGGGRKRADFVL